LDRSITVTVEGGRWRGTGATLLGLEEEEVQEEEEEGKEEQEEEEDEKKEERASTNCAQTRNAPGCGGNRPEVSAAWRWRRRALTDCRRARGAR